MTNKRHNTSRQPPSLLQPTLKFLLFTHILIEPFFQQTTRMGFTKQLQPAQQQYTLSMS